MRRSMVAMVDRAPGKRRGLEVVCGAHTGRGKGGSRPLDMLCVCPFFIKSDASRSCVQRPIMALLQCPAAWRRGETPSTLRASVSNYDAELMALRDSASLDRAIEDWQSKAASATVPTLLHQSWKSCSINPDQSSWRRQCERVLPSSWRTWLWTDDDNRDFMRSEFPSFLKLYDSYDMHIKRVDMVRYFYLWRFGGVYMDLDFACLRDFAEITLHGHPLLRAGRATFGSNAPHVNCYNATCVPYRSEAVPNAFMAAPPRHPFFAWLIHRLPSAANRTLKGHRSPIYSTGPGFLSESVRWYARDALRRRRASLTLLPKNYVFNWVAFINSKRHPCGYDAMHVNLRMSDVEQIKLWRACAAKLHNAAVTTFWSHSWAVPSAPSPAAPASSSFALR